jgi:uncharacterized damage-inducible protein DinB
MKEIMENYLSDSVQSFRTYKKLAERAIEQVSDEDFFRQIDPESNSIAIIVKHIAGNQISRWTDFLTTDGEKPTRNRDTEFKLIEDTRYSLMEFWERGWGVLFDALEQLTVDELSKHVTIRGVPHTIIEAINRQLTHYSYHVGQIVFLAKHFQSLDWRTLSVRKNRSAEFNKFLNEKRPAGDATRNRMEVPLEFIESKKEREGE